MGRAEGEWGGGIMVAGGFNAPSPYAHKAFQKEEEGRGKKKKTTTTQHFTLWKFVLGLNNRKPIMQIITLTDSNPLSALHTVYILISIYFLLLSMTEQSSG